MKKIGTLIIAAIIGSAISIGAVLMLNLNEQKVIKVEHSNNNNALLSNLQNSKFSLDFTQVAEYVMPAVVHIKATQIQQVRTYQYHDPFQDLFGDDIFRHFFGPQYRQPSPQQRSPQTRVGTGSGVIINSDGYIVTNNHVIDNADDIEITLDDNRTFKAKIIGTDPSTDLAVLKVDETDLPYITFSNSDAVKVGEWVLAVGNPFNLNSTVTAGIVSAKGRNINILQDKSAIESFIQTDAAINPGNSGGALVNMQGGLIGINTAIASPTGSYAGYGFAVPSNIVSKVVDDLIEFGMVQRGYLGLMIRNVDAILMKEKDLKVSSGVYVDSIAQNSAAGAAGIKKGDVIIGIDSINIRTTSQLLEIVGQQHPGNKITLMVDRNGKVRSFDVVLRNKDGKEKLTDKVEQNILQTLGVEIEEIDKKTAKKLGVDNGLKITKINAGTIRQQTQIRIGFIITKVDGKKVESVSSFSKYLDSKKGGVMLEGMYEDNPNTYYYAFGM